MVDLYLTTACGPRSRREFQYRTGHYFFMLGMVAEPVIYLVVWTTIAEQQGGSVQRAHRRVLRGVLHRLDARPEHEHRLRSAVAGSTGSARATSTAICCARCCRSTTTSRGSPVGRSSMIVLWIPIAIGLSLAFDPTLDPRPAEIATFAVAIWGAYLIRTMLQESLGMLCFWTTRGAAIFDLYMTCSSSSCPAASSRCRSCPTGCRTIARLPPVPVGVLLPDREPRRRSDERGARARALHAALLDPRSGSRSSASRGVSRSAATRRSGADVNAFRVSWLFFKLGVLNELQYRVNFFVCSSCRRRSRSSTGLVVLALVYSHTDELNGWSQSELSACSACRSSWAG